MTNDPNIALKEREVSAREEYNRIEREKLLDHSRGKWLVFFGTIGAAGIAAFVAFYIKAEKDADIAALHEKIDKIIEARCKDEIYKERLSYVGGACEKMMKYHRDSWAEIKINNEILQNQE